MSWTLGKAEKQDTNRINELFIEMLQNEGEKHVYLDDLSVTKQPIFDNNCWQ